LLAEPVGNSSDSDLANEKGKPPMRHRLRTLLVPRPVAGLQFTLYELVGLIMVAAISLAIGLSFLHDILAVSLGIIGASLFNGIACYIVGVGIGRFSGRHLNAEQHPVVRFTIRDMLWLTAVVALLVAWRVGHGNWKQDQAMLRQVRGEFLPIEGKLRRLEQSRTYRAEELTRLQSELSTRSPITDERVKQIEENLAQHNRTYNAAAEQFETVTSPFIVTPPHVFDWEDIIIAMPDLSVNEMLAYKQHKRVQWLREQEKQRSQ
jgi:hypothetical protein